MARVFILSFACKKIKRKKKEERERGSGSKYDPRRPCLRCAIALSISFYSLLLWSSVQNYLKKKRKVPQQSSSYFCLCDIFNNCIDCIYNKWLDETHVTVDGWWCWSLGRMEAKNNDRVWEANKSVTCPLLVVDVQLPRRASASSESLSAISLKRRRRRRRNCKTHKMAHCRLQLRPSYGCKLA